MMRERLLEYYSRGQDSGLVPKKTKPSPPPAPLLEKSDGSVTKAKTLALEASKQSARDKTLEKSSRTLREKLEKLRNSNPTPEEKKDIPIFKLPPPRHHTTYRSRSGHKGSHSLHEQANNPLQTSQTSAHDTTRVPKIVKVAGKPAEEDVQHPKQRSEYRQKDTQETHQMRKAARQRLFKSSTGCYCSYHTTLSRKSQTTASKSKLSQTTSPYRLALIPATQQCHGLKIWPHSWARNLNILIVKLSFS